MISVEEARTIIVSRLEPLGIEEIARKDGLGRVLAEPLTAARTQPPFASSAMDGFAVHASDLGPGPARFVLRGESAAAHPFDRSVPTGSAIRVSTGAALPAGVNQVVPREQASVEGAEVILDARPIPGRHVREPGVDFHEGQLLLDAGARLRPEGVSLAASCARETLTVHRRPTVAVLASGDELVEPGHAIGASQIVNSNAPGVVALVRELGGIARYLGIARDDPDDVREKLGAAKEADLLVTIGGASVGDHDHLRRVFRESGGELFFERIAVKPGKPTWFGRMGTVCTLGLPGNPVSALAMAHLLLVPALCQLAGERQARRLRFFAARLAVPLPATDKREVFVRGAWTEEGRVAPLDNQDSSALSALARADVLIRRPAHALAASAGDHVDVLVF